MVICAAPSYLAEHGKPADEDALSRHVGIVYGRSGRVVPWHVRDPAGQELKPRIDARLVFDDTGAIADAAIAGAGLAWLPCWLVAKHVRTGELELASWTATIGQPPRSTPSGHSRYLPIKTRMAIDALVWRKRRNWSATWSSPETELRTRCPQDPPPCRQATIA